jgi:hypothetical protein
MRIFFDTEFIEDGKTIDLISIGLVRDDDKTYYAISSEFDESKANDWVKKNVLSKLGDAPRKPRKQIAEEIIKFVGEKPEFWAYYADYDWVVLCQLYGTMMDLPDGWPMFCMDLKQLLVEKGNPKIEKQDDGSEHNALSDATWARDTHAFVNLSDLGWRS